MATRSATQEISTITPPSSSHGSAPRGPWDLAVPIDNEHLLRVHSALEGSLWILTLLPEHALTTCQQQNSGLTDEKSYMPGSDRPIKSAYHLRQPLTQHINGATKMSEPQPSKPLFTPENEYLNPGRNGSLARKKSDISQDGSEHERQPEAHRTGPASKTVPRAVEKGKKGKKRRVSMTSVNGKKDPEDDERNWIHRDKLAVIESKELEEAGFVGRVSRSASRAAGPASVSRQQSVQDLTLRPSSTDPLPKVEMKKQRTVSPIPSEEEQVGTDGAREWDLRTPEEIADQGQGHGQYFVQPLPARPNGSRLPLPKNSPAPVPTTIVERDSPLTRSRNSSSAYGTPEIGQLRPRSRSVGSQVLLDDDAPHTPTLRESSVNGDSDRSSPKAAVPTRANPTSAKRKSGVQPRVVSSTNKARNSSQASRDSPQKRPGTSSGLLRPSTGHQPEGDPPWMASMYKPDPRLPPDQQMLPTHAKRMAQEQWEKEGKTGTVYDREFRLLNTEEIKLPEEKPMPELRRSSETKTTVLSTWPLNGEPPLGSPRSMNSSSRPNTGGTEHGGYRTMPTIAPIPQPTTPVMTESKVRPTYVPRLQDPPEDIKEKKGCGACCIVM
ncbi:hypothetical protein E2P81_ATG02702 [Venturia nashicola]|uniref:TeaA receptor TeaR n=1 Tax=Venturia nashicola TaxID=86259 RepID=A0A4Z1PBD5_9PEZI|nr:hypothetical protein E6O75_ATG02764 [Venturia nashicola]TLD36920.1 hypothetical protein E2P81_ATG02702 [Venturia nashicola]